MSTSPHSAGQTQRSMPVQPHAPNSPHAPHLPHAAHPAQVAHGPNAPHHNVSRGPQPVARTNPAAATAPLPMDDDDDLVMLDDDSITLEDDGQDTPPAAAATSAAGASPAAHPAAPMPKKITFNQDALGGRQRTWKRKPHFGGTGACRVKTFHGKCSDQGLEYLDDAINVFLDEHPDIEVKFVQSNIGMFDGKFKDFALIVNVWY